MSFIANIVWYILFSGGYTKVNENKFMNIQINIAIDFEYFWIMDVLLRLLIVNFVYITVGDMVQGMVFRARMRYSRR